MLTIASSQNNILYRLPAPLQRLRQRFPGARLRLITIDSHQAVDVLRSGDADLAVVRMPVHLPPDIEPIRLPTTPIALIAPLGHPIIRKRFVTPADICAYPLVAYHKNEWLRQHCDRVFQSHGCTPDIVLEAGSAEIVKTYVRAGFGLAIVASLDFLGRPDTELVAIPIERHFGHDLTTALMRRGRFRPPFLHFLLELLADHPGGEGAARARKATASSP
jgi:DNA-binding transcriptional LysR family regulator